MGKPHFEKYHYGSHGIKKGGHEGRRGKNLEKGGRASSAGSIAGGERRMDKHSLDLARGGYGSQRPPGGLRWSCLLVSMSCVVSPAPLGTTYVTNH